MNLTVIMHSLLFRWQAAATREPERCYSYPLSFFYERAPSSSLRRSAWHLFSAPHSANSVWPSKNQPKNRISNDRQGLNRMF
jgi:hypothetical protein